MASESAPLSPEYLAADRSGSIVAASTVMLVSSTIFFAIRLWARRLKDIAFGWQDFLLLPCWILVVLACVSNYLSVHKGGAGRHIQEAIMADPHVLVTRGKLVYALTWFSGVANLFSRLSILLLYLQIFRTKFTRWATWFVIFYLVASFIAGSVVTLVQAKPISYNWTQFEHPPAQGRVLINQFLYYKLQGLFNMICDVLMLMLPVPVLVSLQQPWSQKFGLAVVFASGSLGMVASILRTASFWTETKTWHTDPTWADVTLMIWTTVESAMYLIAASLVGSRPFFACVPAIVKSLTSSKGSSRSTWRRLVGKSDQTRSNSNISDVETAHENMSAKGSIMVSNEFSVERDSDEEKAGLPQPPDARYFVGREDHR